MSATRLTVCAALVLCACSTPLASEDTGDTGASDTSTGPGSGNSASETGSPSQASEPTTSDPSTSGPVTSEPVTTATTEPSTLDPTTTTGDPGTTTTTTDTGTGTSTTDEPDTTGTTDPAIDPPPGCDAALVHYDTLVITDATDLTSLQCIVEVRGQLRVENTQTLVSFAPLANLAQVKGNVIITGNAALVDLDGLAGLERVTDKHGMIYVGSNPALIDVTGLQSLRQVDTVIIARCDALTDLTGLQGPIVGFTKGDWRLEISDNADLGSLAPLTAIEGFTGTLRIESLPKLADLGDLAGFLGSEIRILEITDNPLLVDLQGLDALGTAGSLKIQGNAALLDLSGLDALLTVSGGISILDNSKLQSLEGLEALTFAMSFTLDGNPALTSLTPLGQLTEIGYLLTIGVCDSLGNDGLVDLHGLEGLTKIRGLSINQNDALQSITAVPHDIGLDLLEAYNNPQLPQAMLLEYLAETDLTPEEWLCNNGGAPATCECHFIDMP